jgi:hypothetical protein
MVSRRDTKKTVKFIVKVSFEREDITMRVSRGQRRYVSWPEAAEMAGPLVIGDILSNPKATKEKLLRIDSSYRSKKSYKIRL